MSNYTQQNHTKHKIFNTSILIASACISAYLTTSFMYEIGLGMNAPLLFAAIGLLMDCVKSYAPTLIMIQYKRSTLVTLLYSAVFASLVCFSGAASVFAVQKGVDAALSNSRVAVVANTKADLVRAEIADLDSLRQSQLNADQITNAKRTSSQITEKREELAKLIDEAASAPSSNMLSQFSNALIIFIAVILEVISLASTVAINSSKSKLETETSCDEMVRDDVRSAETQRVSSHVSPSISTSQSEILRQNETSILTLDENGVFQADAGISLTREQLLQEMKMALLNKKCKTTQKDFYNKFRNFIKQKEARNYFEDLAARGVLSQTSSNTFELASI